MALKTTLQFALKVIGDGTDRTVTATLTSAPMGLIVPQVMGGTHMMFPGLSTLLITDVINPTSNLGKTISASVLTGVVTFTYASGQQLAADEEDVIYGTLVF